MHEEENEGGRNVDQHITLSTSVPASDSSFNQLIHHVFNQSTKNVTENNQRPNQDGQGDTNVDQITSITSDTSTKKLEREPSVTSKEVSSPAFLFITWSDVYAYMRSDGVKVGCSLYDQFLIMDFYSTPGNW